MIFNEDTPTKTGIYLIDRGMQGKQYRHYDAGTDVWSLSADTLIEAGNNIGINSSVGFFPWVGPLTGPNFKKGMEDKVETNEDKPVKVAKAAKVKPAAKKMAKQTGANLVNKIVKSTKITHPDGTVFFREDRQKWVAVANGTQEAARPTPEACLAFLKKKYNIDGVVLK
jgi:ribosomal 50S subunit-recycling heat shock protein